MSNTKIPIFPLNLVLFPNQLLPLHIFEERYKQMIKDVTAADKIFGINLIEPEPGKSESDLTEPVGCTAEINLAVPLDDGRLNIVVAGRKRYRILHYTDKLPYHIAEVEFFSDEPDHSESTERTAQKVKSEFLKLIELANKLNNASAFDGELPLQSEQLSLLVTSALPVSNHIKQQLLEMTSTSQRLELALVYLDEAQTKFEHQLMVRNAAKNNGHAGKLTIN
jgi:Lon protease-like protein